MHTHNSAFEYELAAAIRAGAPDGARHDRLQCAVADRQLGAADAVREEFRYVRGTNKPFWYQLLRYVGEFSNYLFIVL